MRWMIILFLVICSTGMLSQPGAADSHDAHGLFSEILQAHVREGRVDYKNLCRDSRLETCLAQLAATDPDTIADEQSQLAFWLNAYNAYTLKIVCDNYPIESITDLHFGGRYIAYVLKKTVWDKKFIVINGRELTLNDIEHKIVRPQFEEPRSHFALVCAAKSCPPLRSEAYEGYKLNEQLDEQGRIFFSEPNKNFFEPDKKIAHLSKIFDWFEKDFGKNQEDVLRFSARFLPEGLAAEIHVHAGEWKVKYTDYDWGLNEY